MTYEERLYYFLAAVARGTVKEFLDALEPSPEPETSSEHGARLLRLGVLAAIVVNQLVEFIHCGRPDLLDYPEEKAPDFRKRLAQDYCSDLALLRNVAEATKHPELKWTQRIPGIEAIRSGNPQICGRDGTSAISRDGEPVRERSLTVLIDTQSRERLLADIVNTCFAALEKLIATPRPVP